jgi:hypothetical protein
MTHLNVLCLLTISLFTAMCGAQDLEYLPPVVDPGVSSDTNISLIVGTIDYARFGRKAERKPYMNSMQIIDADQTWPPRWYVATALYTPEMFREDSILRRLRFYHLGYSQVSDGYLSYLYLAPADPKDNSSKLKFGYSFILLDQHMNAVDTINSRILYNGKLGKDYYTNPNLEKLAAVEMDTVLDFSKVTGNKKDRAVKSNFWIIEVLDMHDKVKFSWNPLYRLNPSLFEIKERLAQDNQDPDGIRWKKINNVFWDYDGNILYSSEVGIGKISKSDGHVIWQVNSSGSPFIKDANNLKCYTPTAFLMRKESKGSVVYSFFEKGMDSLCPPQGVVFEQDKASLKIKNIQYTPPAMHYVPSGHGGFEYNPDNGAYAMDYGVMQDRDSSSSGPRAAMDYKTGNGHKTILELPKWNYAFGFNFLENWPVPARPVIKKEGAQLIAVGDMKQWTWYKLEGAQNTTITRVGNGPSIKPEKGAAYCVAGPLGIGYAVSRIYDTKIKSPQ